MTTGKLFLCGEESCPICWLHQRLELNGAAPQRAGISFRESQCSIKISFEKGCQCLTRLRLDQPRASYRQRSAGTQTKMCDFALAAKQEGKMILAVMELKKGVPRKEHIEQLQAGLDLLYKYFSTGENACPHALLIVGRKSTDFQDIINRKKYRLKFGNSNVRLQVEKCGDGLIYRDRTNEFILSR